MKKELVVLVFALSGCAGNAPNPNAQEKYDEFIPAASRATTGSELEEIAVLHGHICRRLSCNEFCQVNAIEASDKPDELVVCRWDEPLPKFPDVVFGTVHSVVHLADDRIVLIDVSVVYTGP